MWFVSQQCYRVHACTRDSTCTYVNQLPILGRPHQCRVEISFDDERERYTHRNPHTFVCLPARRVLESVCAGNDASVAENYTENISNVPSASFLLMWRRVEAGKKVSISAHPRPYVVLVVSARKLPFINALFSCECGGVHHCFRLSSSNQVD